MLTFELLPILRMINFLSPKFISLFLIQFIKISSNDNFRINPIKRSFLHFDHHNFEIILRFFKKNCPDLSNNIFFCQLLFILCLRCKIAFNISQLLLMGCKIGLIQLFSLLKMLRKLMISAHHFYQG